jgi:hypothetical protein
LKAYTVYQPFAALIAVKAKKYETRGRRLNYRGTIAIHAGKKWVDAVIADWTPEEIIRMRVLLADYFPDVEFYEDELPHGAVIAVADIVDCERVTAAHGSECVQTLTSSGAINFIDGDELTFGDLSIGRYAYKLANVRRLPVPIPCRGQQGLFTLTEEVEQKIKEQLI